MKFPLRVLLIGFLLHAFPSFSQTSVYHRYIVEFTDKNNSPYSISNPSAFLSERAIQRRTNYGIPITLNDLPVDPDYIAAVLATGVSLINKSKWLNSISIETSDSLALVAIKALPFVKSSEAVAPRQGSGNGNIIKWNDAIVPSEKTTDQITFDYGTAANQIEMLHGESLHDRGYRGNGMIIAVLDLGFLNANQLPIFQNLNEEGRILGYWNFVKGNDSVFYNGTHGCSVLSTIAADLPGQMVGTAPDVSVYLFVTEDGNSEYPIEEHNWAAAAERADSLGADMISSSLGYSQFTDASFNYTYAQMDGHTTMVSRAASFAAQKGMIVCSSAGNEGNHEWYYITAPADADSIITVGAVDSTGIITAFSSHGPSADGRIKPNVVGQGILTTIVEPVSGIIVQGNGTSFSNPVIAGMTACLWEAHPEKNNMQIITTIEKSASLYFDPNDSMGYGIPNYEIADLMLSGMAPDNLQLTAPLVYPNPFTNNFGVIYYSAREQHPQVQIFNMLGQRVQEFKTTFSIGYNYLPFNALQFSPQGSYFIRFNFDDHIDVARVIKADP
jgi:serine protease AprX